MGSFFPLNANANFYFLTKTDINVFLIRFPSNKKGTIVHHYILDLVKRAQREKIGNKISKRKTRRFSVAKFEAGLESGKDSRILGFCF